jgi:hypothetical protein
MPAFAIQIYFLACSYNMGFFVLSLYLYLEWRDSFLGSSIASRTTIKRSPRDDNSYMEDLFFKAVGAYSTAWRSLRDYTLLPGTPCRQGTLSAKHGDCAAKAFYSCPAIISRRPGSQNTSKESQLNSEKDSRRKQARSHVTLEKSS